MLWKKIKSYFKRKQGTTVVAAALASQVAYGQTELKVDDKKQDDMEKIVIQNEVDGEDVSITINGRAIHGNPYVDWETYHEVYVDQQKELYEKGGELKTDTVPFQKFVKHRIFGWFNPGTKDIHQNYIKLDKPKDVWDYVKNEYSYLSRKEQKQKAREIFESLGQYNDTSSLAHKAVLSHEVQHQVSDKNNVYAPGMSVEQFGVIYQVDEITATFSSLLLLDNYCQDKINQGASLKKVFEVFDKSEFSDFAFYKDVYARKKHLGLDKFQALLWQKTSQMWQEVYQKNYAEPIRACMELRAAVYDVGSLAFGHDDNFVARLDKILNGVKDNPVLKQAGVMVGDFSRYVSDKVVPLSLDMQRQAEALTLYYTGMGSDEAKRLSDKMPGNQTEDALNWAKVLSQKPVSKEVEAVFVRKNEPKDVSKSRSSLSLKKQVMLRSRQSSR